MTPNEKLRIAVAEAEGWRPEKWGESNKYTRWVKDGACAYEPGEDGLCRELPDYTTDRNAIIGAIARMSEHERNQLAWKLLEWSGDRSGHGFVAPREFLAILTAEPETLCRLYLKAKGIDFEES